MGLTGLILDVNIKLRKIKSTIIKEKILKTKNLTDTLKHLSNKKFEYSVAWVDASVKKIMGKELFFW